MKMYLKVSTILFISYLLGFVKPVTAQDQAAVTKPEVPLVQAKKKKEQLVLDGIHLTEKEKKALMPLHNEYQAQVSQISDFNSAFFNQLSNQEQLLDEEAWTKLDDFVELQKSKYNLQKKYVAKFRKVIPPKKAAYYFLLENSLESLSNENLASTAGYLPKNK